jgi:hypothetical protein
MSDHAPSAPDEGRVKRQRAPRTGFGVGGLLLVAFLSPRVCAATELVRAEPRIAIALAGQEFSSRVWRDRFGPCGQAELRASIYLDDIFEPLMAVRYGVASGDGWNRIALTTLAAGFRLNLTPHRRLSIRVGAAYLQTSARRRAYYSPCLPGNPAVREYTTGRWGYEVVAGSEYRVSSRCVSVGLEAGFVTDRPLQTQSTATLGSGDISGPSLRMYLAWAPAARSMGSDEARDDGR